MTKSKATIWNTCLSNGITFSYFKFALLFQKLESCQTKQVFEDMLIHLEVCVNLNVICFSKRPPLKKNPFYFRLTIIVKIVVKIIVKWKPRNVIALGQRETDYINWLIIISILYIRSKRVICGLSIGINLITLTDW